MDQKRLRILLGVAAVLLAMLIWHWISGWGLVTVHVSSKPISDVIRSIERQGGIELVTNADPATPITMDVDRVPAATAVDVLAAYIDGNWSVGYVTGPSKADVKAGVEAITQGGRPNGYRTFGFGGGFGGGGGMMGDASNVVIDARVIPWNVTPSDDKQLQSYLDQLSQKTGLMAVTPESWNPPLTGTPSGGKAASAIKSLIRSVKGEWEEIFVLRVSDRDPFAGGDNGGDNGQRVARTDGGFGRGGNGGGPPPDGGGRREFHPEWAEERAQARIAQLPADQQAQAKKDMDEMRNTWQKIRDLPEDQRRAAMQQIFNSPVVQDRMTERQMSRESMRSPEKRAERFRQYVQTKTAAQSSPGR